MRSNIGRIVARTGLNLQESGTDVVLKWKVWTGTTTVDATTQSTLGTSTDMCETVKGFAHIVKATSSVRQMVEIEVGDCLLDLHQDVELKGRAGLVFLIDGEEWKQKEIGDKVVSYPNAIVAGGQRIFQTLVLRKTS